MCDVRRAHVRQRGTLELPPCKHEQGLQPDRRMTDKQLLYGPSGSVVKLLLRLDLCGFERLTSRDSGPDNDHSARRVTL
jgi:hypothetical protein